MLAARLPAKTAATAGASPSSRSLTSTEPTVSGVATRQATTDNGGVSGSTTSPRLPRHLKGVVLPPGSDAAALSSRYGTDRPRYGAWLVALAVLVPFIAWAVWAAVEHADQDLRWETSGFSDITDKSITVQFTVYLPPGSSAECVVRAMDIDGVEVGRATVPIDSEGGSTSVVYALPVTAQPSTAFVETCQLEETA